jgi:hypothetical protein
MRTPITAAASGLGAAIAAAVTLAVAASAVVTPATAPAPTAMPAHEWVSSQSDRWVGGAARDAEKGLWRAYIRRGDDMILLGYYNEEKDARAAGRKAARAESKKEKENNNVMDGPGCRPPAVLC